jgi:hypothetical protein
MFIKSIAFDASRRIGLSRTHAYELIAAAYGYNSYAAFKADAILVPRPTALSGIAESRRSRIQDRCVGLGHLPESADAAAVNMDRLLSEREVGAVRIADVLRALLWWRENEAPYSQELPDQTLDSEECEFPELFTEEGPTAELSEALAGAAEGSNPLAHYAVALVHEWSHYAADSPDLKPYWYQQRQAGQKLSAAATEWADQYERFIESKRLYETHLRTAAKLGQKDALFDLARNFGEPDFFDGGHELPQIAPAELSRLALEVARPKQAHQYLVKAAEGGDTDAMLELIETYESDDLVSCWKWVYLARHFDVDLMADDYVAINEDGSAYDDDVGGPAFADGRDGVALQPIDPQGDAIAQEAALILFRAASADSHS